MSLHTKVFIKFPAAVVALLIFSVTADAQFSPAKLEEQFNGYNKKVLMEKLYMHVDRNFYLAGDILWCKLYVVDATLHQPLDISKVGYVEVLNENNTAVLQAKISLIQGKGNGSLILPVSLTSGNYKIRAYTNWMKNAGPDYFFEKQVTIVNTQKNRDLPQPPATTAGAPDIRFFPEGGNLVAGIPSKMACKVQGTDGKGLNFRGGIINENNDTVVRFHSFKFGTGSFNFTPAAGHTYKAVVDAGQKTYVKDLPEIYKQGYVMQLSADKKTVTVSVKTNLAETQAYLLVHTRQSLRTVLQGRIENGQAIFSVDKSKLGDGISNFTVFSAAGKPVCERLYFIYPRRELAINIASDKTAYDTRSKIDLSVQPADENGKPLDADMSVAVYRMDELQSIDKNNIQSFLWLSSDLKGQIESPGFYFDKDSSETFPAMDNLMLTQGWRRFHWDDVLQDKAPVMTFIPELSGHVVTGRVVSTVTGQPVENIETYLSAPGFNANILAYISDADGKLKFDFKRMHGTQEIIVQTNPTADSMVRVEINNPFYEGYSASRLPMFRLTKANEKFLLEQSIGVQVQNVYSGSKLKRFYGSPDSTSLFEKPDASYFLDDYVRFTTMEEVMREYVSLMDVQKRKDKFTFQLLDNYYLPINNQINKTFFDSNPLILIDGVPIFNNDKLINFDPLKMRKLEVYNRRYFLGDSFFSGILNWTTYKGDLANLELDPHALVIDYEGMQLQREFYSPTYETPQAVASHLPDYRTLLYWSPSVSTDAKGKRHVNFYSSDKKGDYVAVIQGLSNNGLCGSAMVQFEVK